MIKKRGFTLVELLAVIVILAIILTIAVPSITSIVDNSRLNSFNVSSDMLERAANTYINANNITVASGSTSQILYSDIKSAGYVNKIVDPISKNECIYSRVYVTNTSGNYTYKGALVCDNYMDIDAYNLVSNGDFSNGTTGWSGIDAINNSVAEKTVTLQYGNISQTLLPNGTAYINHVLYNTALIKADASNAIMISISDGATQSVGYHNGDNKFHRISTQFTVGGTAVNVYAKVQDNRASNWTKFYVTDYILYDLTSIYGVGNEPTKAQMDNIMSNMGK